MGSLIFLCSQRWLPGVILLFMVSMLLFAPLAILIHMFIVNILQPIFGKKRGKEIGDFIKGISYIIFIGCLISWITGK